MIWRRWEIQQQQAAFANRRHLTQAYVQSLFKKDFEVAQYHDGGKQISNFEMIIASKIFSVCCDNWCVGGLKL